MSDYRRVFLKRKQTVDAKVVTGSPKGSAIISSNADEAGSQLSGASVRVGRLCELTNPPIIPQ